MSAFIVRKVIFHTYTEGKLSLACPAVRYGWLDTKLFERAKFVDL